MYLLYLFAWKLIGVLPEKSAYKLSKVISDRIYRKNGKGVKRLRGNYQRVMPNMSEREIEDLTKDGMRSYLRYWFDTFRLNKWSKSRIIETTFVVRENLLRDPIATKQGCIIALPHAGNWDHAAAYFCSTGITLTAVVEKLKDHFDINCDGSKMALGLYKEAQKDLYEFMKTNQATHFQRLTNFGLEKDIKHCLTNNTAPVLPIYQQGKLIRSNNNI